jgi:hypothetical protein
MSDSAHHLITCRTGKEYGRKQVTSSTEVYILND